METKWNLENDSAKPVEGRKRGQGKREPRTDATTENTSRAPPSSDPPPKVTFADCCVVRSVDF